MLEQSLEERAVVHAALAEPHRLAIVDALGLTDLTPSTLAQRLAINSNLIAHHVQVLVEAGVVERRVSSGDHRRRYLHLRNEVLEGLLLSTRMEVVKVLFVCTQNSARSQLAAALWYQIFGRPATSAGTHPAVRIHPLAIEVASRHGLDLSRAVPQSLADMTDTHGLVITVCDQANEELANLRRDRLHWSIPDPVAMGTMEAFEDAYQQIHGQIELLVAHMSTMNNPGGWQS